MKKTLYLFGFFAAFGISKAQVTDTVSVGSGYVNEVFYSLQNGEVSSEERAEWDIAFSVSSSGSTILTNGGMGTELYQYPNGDISHWSTLDTAGLSNWGALFNSDTSWAVGAFNNFSEGFDVGWGNYNIITHHVTGDSLFVIKLGDENYKKLWIEKLASGKYTFKYANLDGTQEVSDSIVKTDYINKNFAYYSIQNQQALDREPENTSWDLLFTKYVRQTPSVYGVTGVLSNIGVKTAEVSGVVVGTADHTTAGFGSNISEIGYDWKSYVFGAGYQIQDSLTYFVQDVDSNIYEMVFTGFGGSADGNFIFTKEMIFNVGVDENQPNIAQFGLYPNPASNFVEMVYAVSEEKPTEFNVFDLSGKRIFTTALNPTVGLNQYEFDITGFHKGIYLVVLSNADHAVQEKLVVQ